MAAAAPARQLGADRHRAARGAEDGAALVLVLVFLLLSVVVGIRTGYHEVDLDEVVFHDTIVEMRSGTGYYQALHDALVVKEDVGPSSARAYRLPTLYVALAQVPESGLRLVMVLPYGVLLVSAWRLGRPYGPWGGAVSVLGVGFWVLGAAPLLFLHAEVWGAALLLAGLALIRERPRSAAAVLAAAVLVRELYGLAFVIGWLRNRRSVVWWVAGAAVGALGLWHLHAAGGYLDPNGYQPPLRFTNSSYLHALSPGDGPLGGLVGVVGGLAGGVGMILAWRRGDAAARVAAGHNLVLAALTITVGRTYWGFVFGPSTVVFAAVTVDLLLRRRSGDEAGDGDETGADTPLDPIEVMPASHRVPDPAT